MSADSNTYYRVAPGVEVIQLTAEKLLFQGNAVRVLLEGGFTGFFFDRLLPLLKNESALQEIIGCLPELAGSDIERHLHDLVESGALLSAHTKERSSLRAPSPSPLSSLLPLAHLTKETAEERLARARIAIFGLEGPGASLATMLAQCNIGTLVLADPYPCRPGNLALMPLMDAAAIGQPRHEAVRLHLAAAGSNTNISVVGNGRLTAADVELAAEQSDFLVGCFDRGFGSVNHWINRASLRSGKPALFAELDGRSATIGPLVQPGVTACYMCYRMRAVACADDFEMAMAYEQHVDRQQEPRMHERLAVPALSHIVAASTCLEILKHLLGLSSHSMAGKLMTINALSMQTEFHQILEQPFCPECKKKVSRRTPLDRSKLIRTASSRGDIARSASALISNRVGIVTECDLLPRDNPEPHLPHVFYATLSTIQNRDGPRKGTPASGKGATVASAQASALGEAIEIYSASIWDRSHVVYASRPGLGRPAIDPRELVLYGDDQYAELHYSRYSETARLGWIPARSLISNSLIYVPATAVLLEYPVAPEEHLFPTSSSGLAAGGTLLEAVLRAALEIIERDAFLITWLNRLASCKVDPFTHPDADVRAHCRAALRRNVRIDLVRLPTDSPAHVFLAVALQSGGVGPVAAIGLGAGLDPAATARSAIWEACQVRTLLRRQLRDPSQRQRMAELADHPNAVETLDDHALLYCSDKLLPALAFVTEQPMQAFDWQCRRKRTTVEELRLLIDHFAAENRDLLFVDLTPSDLATLDLHVARAIIPGYQPIHFGAKGCRLGGARLFELPLTLGLKASASTPATLNPYPHPLG